jgi:hypothetical protein
MWIQGIKAYFSDVFDPAVLPKYVELNQEEAEKSRYNKKNVKKMKKNRPLGYSILYNSQRNATKFLPIGFYFELKSAICRVKILHTVYKYNPQSFYLRPIVFDLDDSEPETYDEYFDEFLLNDMVLNKKGVTMYLVSHGYSDGFGYDHRSVFRFYDELEEAQKAVRKLRRQKPYKSHPKNFSIQKIGVDQPIGWENGFRISKT